MNKYALVSMSLILSLASSCGPSHNHPRAAIDQRKFYLFTHGDPLQLIDGAQLNHNSFIKAADTASFAGYSLARYEYISQTSEVEGDPDATPNIEAGQEAPVDLRKDPVIPYEFRPGAEGMVYVPTSGEDDTNLEFSQVGDSLVLKRAFNSNVEMLHYSMKADHEAFSLLYKVSDTNDGTYLVALYFTKVHPGTAALADVSKDFHFLMGAGVVNPWVDDLHLNLCGKMSTIEEEQIREAISAWVKKGHIGKRTLAVERKEVAPVYSDLNSNCLSIVDDYLFENNNKSAEAGVTYPLLDLKRQRVEAAHIFISRKAFIKLYASFVPKEFQRTVTHEVGHFLGLDHEFVTNPDGKAKFKSIMSYDADVYEVTAHDFAAIELLYGPYPQ